MQPDFLGSLNPAIAPFQPFGSTIRTPAPMVNTNRPVIRTAANKQQPAAQQQQKPQSNQTQSKPNQNIVSKIGSFLNRNVVKPTVNDVKNAGDVVNALRQGTQGLAQAGVAAATHNPVAEHNAVVKTNNAMNSSLNASRGLITPQEANSRSFTQGFLKPVARSALTYAPFAVGGSGVADTAAANTLRAKAVGSAINAATNEGAGTLANAAQQRLNGQKVNLKQDAKGALANVAFGGASDIAHTAAPALKTAKDNRVPLNQSGHLFTGKGKDVSKIPEADIVNPNLSTTARTKGFIVKEGPALNGKQEVIRAVRDPQTGKLGTYKETIDVPKPIKAVTKKPSTPGKDNVPVIDSAGHSESPISGRTIKIPENNANTLKNPVGAKFANSFPTVKNGDYGRARAMTQQASNPIKVRADQAATSIEKATKGMSLADFGKAVESGSGGRDKALSKAIDRTKDVTNTAHAISQALGGDTPFIKNFFSHNGIWDLSKPEDAARFEELAKEKGSVDPYSFGGIDRQPRVFQTIAEGEKAGFHVRNDIKPADFIKQYADRVGYALRQQALSKGFTEADMGNPNKPEVYNMGDGTTLPLSKEGKAAIMGFEKTAGPSNTPRGAALKGYRALNRGAKETLLSVSQFHPININALQGAPTLAVTGHPILAAKGLAGTVGSINKNVSDRIMQKAVNDGTVDAAAKLGTPIKFGSDYATEGKLSTGSLRGEKMIFERQLPAMHAQMVRALVKDLNRRNIPLDSPQARDAGLTVNKIMGFVNTEVENHNPNVQKALSDIALAPQFTRAKWEVLSKALNPKNVAGKGSVSGNYARAAVLGKYAAEAGIVSAGGAALGGKQNNAADNLKQTAIAPAIPTGIKDSKGNTIRLRIPSNFVSEAAGLVGSVSRGNNGRLNISANPTAIPGNVANYGRSRLAVVPGDALKLATNTDFAQKPLYDSTADAKTKAEQAATTLAAGSLPIGGQGIAETNAVTSRLPQASRDILNNDKPGTNPILKGVLSSLGATPQTDTTTGKGLQTSQYYSELDKAKAGLNANDLAAFNSIHQQTKDPVTGKYVIKPTVFDSVTKSNLYLQHPNVLAADTKLNQTLQSEGQKIDPFFNLSPSQQKAYLAYETMAPLSADRTDWQNKNNSWYQGFSKAQSSFFNSLPAADPNKPTAPIKFPVASAAVQNQLNAYDNLPKGSPQSSAFLSNHPEVLNYFADTTAYDNAIRTARGYAAVKQAPTTNAGVQKFMNTYSAADKATRATLRNNQPGMYQAMIAAYDNQDLASLAKTAGVNQLQGEPDTTSKELKQISSLASDIYQTGGTAAKPTYGIVPAGWMLGLSNSSGSGGSSGSSSGSSTIAGGSPVFKAPTSIGTTYTTLNKLLASSEKVSKPKSIKSGKGKISKGKVASTPKPPKFPKPPRASSISQSAYTGQRVKLAV